jgi:TonB family protein
MPRPAQPAPVAKPAQPAPKPSQVILPPAKPVQPVKPSLQAPVKPTEAPKPAPQPAKPVQQAPAKPVEAPKPAPQPVAKTPLATAAAAKAAAEASGQLGAKKKAPMGMIVGIAAAVIAIGAAAFFFVQSSNTKAEQARLENERVVAKAKAEAEAAKKAAEEASAKQRAAAEAEIARLRAEAEKTERLLQNEAEKRRIAQETLARTPGVISITTIPEGAEVSIDGSTPQITPTTITNVTPGMRKVVISMPGYDPVTQLVEVKGAQSLDLGIVNLQSILGTLMLRSEPADAEYAVFPADKTDGAPLRTGRTPGSVDKLPPGEYVIKFARPGLVPTSEHATIAGKEVVDVNSTFIVGGVSLTSNPSGAAVRMNGEYLGVTPLVRPELQPAQASFEFTLPNYEPVKLGGEITNKETLRLHAEMLHVDRIARPAEVKSPPKIVSSISPSIPANLGEVQGEVVISVVVTKQGTIRDIRVDKSTNPALTEPCLKAVNQWRFSPAISKAGLPVNMRLSIPFRFDVKPQPAQEESNLPIGFGR